MVLSNIGRERIVSLIENDISSIKYGDDGTSPSKTDTDLISAFVLEKTPTIETSGNRLSASSIVYSTELNGETIREEGLYLNDILFDRVVFPDFEKNDENEFVITNTIRVV